MTRQKPPLALWAIALLVLALRVGATVRAEDGHRVGIVVRHGDGRVVTRCVTFAENEITAWEALQRSGLDVVAVSGSGLGTALCRIDGEGCGADNCFCALPNYWSVWQYGDGRWTYSPIGVTALALGDGDLVGFGWGEGRMPLVGPDQICASPQRPVLLPLILVPVRG